MPRGFLTDGAKSAFVAAIEAIELHSSAEVVVSVRARSASYLHADLIVGVLFGIAALAFMMFSPYEFSLLSILIDPIVFAVLIGLAASRLGTLRRALTPEKIRDGWVDRAAHAAFFEKGVRHTRNRIGVLLYVSLTERSARVLADSGVVEAVDHDAWQDAISSIENAVAERKSGEEVAKVLEGLGTPLADALPVLDDDVDELPNEVHT
jgi:putative membrane protein